MQRPPRRRCEHRARLLRKRGDDGAQRAVALLDARQGRVQQLAGVELACCDESRLLPQRKILRVRHVPARVVGALLGSTVASNGRSSRVASSSARIAGSNTCATTSRTSRSLSSKGTPASVRAPAACRLKSLIRVSLRSAASIRTTSAAEGDEPYRLSPRR